jgi:hypothetical protein
VPKSVLLSLFLAWHLLAIALGALPDPNVLTKVEPRTVPVSGLTRALDAVAARFAVVPSTLWYVTAPVRYVAGHYLRVTGVGQKWMMFANPPRYDEYMRVRYYVAGEEAPQPRWMATELIMPTGREDGLRLFRSFRDSYQDKAYATALERFYAKRGAALMEPNTPSEALPDDLAPVSRYFARRFARALPPGERVVRTELWYGRAWNRAPGASIDPEAYAERRAALLEYYDGPIENRFRLEPYPQYHTMEAQGDLQWVLDYFEES